MNLKQNKKVIYGKFYTHINSLL